jgi:hypothetical protein
MLFGFDVILRGESSEEPVLSEAEGSCELHEEFNGRE